MLNGGKDGIGTDGYAQEGIVAVRHFCASDKEEYAGGYRGGMGNAVQGLEVRFHSWISIEEAFYEAIEGVGWRAIFEPMYLFPIEAFPLILRSLIMS